MKKLFSHSIMATALCVTFAASVATVFADGSKNLVGEYEYGQYTYYTGKTTDEDKNGLRAHRPYLEWRNRTQFDMEAENVIYVYAEAGETVLLGTNVASASNYSIAAITKEGLYAYEDENGDINTKGTGTREPEPQLNLSDDLEGASIAVTMPTEWYSKTAVVPTAASEYKDGKAYIENAPAGDTSIYLFKPEKNKGLISSLAEERIDLAAAMNDVEDKYAYEPISFTAPVTGTYAVRFLSSDYGVNDRLDEYVTAPEIGQPVSPDASTGTTDVNLPAVVENSATWTFDSLDPTADKDTPIEQRDVAAQENSEYKLRIYKSSGRVLDISTESIINSSGETVKVEKGRTLRLRGNGDIAKKENLLCFVPKASGTVTILAESRLGSSGGDKKFVIQQGENIVENTIVNKIAQYYTVDVVAREPVYIYAIEAELSVYSVKYTANTTETVTEVTDETKWTFPGSEVGNGTYSSNIVTADGLTIHATNTYKADVSNNGLKFNSDRSSTSGTKYGCLSFTPSKRGYVQVIGNGELYIKEEGGSSGHGSNNYTLEVSGGKTVYIYTNSNSTTITSVKYSDIPIVSGILLSKDKGDFDGVNTAEITTLNNQLLLVTTGGKTIEAADSGLKFNSGVNTQRIAFIPAADGTVSITAHGSSDKTVTIEQEGNKYKTTFEVLGKTSEESRAMAVRQGRPVYIYANAGWNLQSINYTPSTVSSSKTVERYANEMWIQNDSTVAAWDVSVLGKDGTIKDGRVWADILFLNAGNHQRSLEPKLNVLTKEGFLYNVDFNGMQPYSFVFYSNNRGFLLDPWGIYTGWNADWLTDDDKKGLGDEFGRLQPLNHSFYSRSGSGDVGPAPVRDEEFNHGDHELKTTILGNYKPTDTNSDPPKDATHQIFFTHPDKTALKAYTGDESIRTLSSEEVSVLDDITYEGQGNYSDNSGNVKYGTKGVGGIFKVNISEEEYATMNSLGSSSIAIQLDFSEYELDDNKKPVLDADNKWKPLTTPATENDPEYNNKVTLSAVVTGAGDYVMSWVGGKDAYGNVVPAGEYSTVIKSYLEMGVAHFPLLDVEYNPWGFKIQMVNEVAGMSDNDIVYYNNEAVNNGLDDMSWYFCDDAENDDDRFYPQKIGDGLNKTGGVKSNYDNPNANGAMSYGAYALEDPEISKIAANQRGYGNFTALDLWTEYMFKLNADVNIGVKEAISYPYVSFVATDGEGRGTVAPFDTKSHVRSRYVLGKEDEENILNGATAEYFPENKGVVNIYENTISTGFVAKVQTTAMDPTENYVTWDITVPAKETANNEMLYGDTYIKVPYDDEYAGTQSQEAIDEQEYLAYELYSSLFEDYVPDEEIIIGEEFVPDWEADASLDENKEPGMLDVETYPGDTEVILYEDMYFEMAELNAEEGYRKEDWEVTANLENAAVLYDSYETAVHNKGAIYKLNSFDTNSGAASIKVKYKLPTVISGGTVVVGIVIDNLYAPSATATVNYDTDTAGDFMNITSDNFNDHITDNMGSNDASVQVSGYNNYITNSNNPYYSELNLSFDESKSSDGNFVDFKTGIGAWTFVYNANNTGDPYSAHKDHGYLDQTANGDIFYLGYYDMTGLAEIVVEASSGAAGATFELFAVDVDDTAVVSMTKAEMEELLTKEASFGTTGVEKSGYGDSNFKNYTVRAAGKTGKMGLVMKCKVPGGYCADFGKYTLKYTDENYKLQKPNMRTIWWKAGETVVDGVDLIEEDASWDFLDAKLVPGEDLEYVEQEKEFAGESFTGYVGGDSKKNNNPRYVDGKLTGNGLSFTAPANGKVTAYMEVGEGKTIVITDSNNNRIAEMDNTGEKTQTSLSAEVSAGQTYYLYVDASRARIYGVCFEFAE